MSSIEVLAWGLKRNITPQLGARLVQQGNRLHYLADRAGICGAFSEVQARSLDNAFPQFINHLELMLIPGNSIPGISTASRCTVTD
jgi:cytoskeleton bundling-enhancing protein CbeA-like protein